MKTVLYIVFIFNLLMINSCVKIKADAGKKKDKISLQFDKIKI